MFPMSNSSDQATARIHLYLFGLFDLISDRKRVHLPTRKIESLLAYLVLYPQLHRRDELAVIFWGDSTDADARHSLRHALTTLRRFFGDDLLWSDRSTVQLNPHYPLWVDVREFLNFPRQIGGSLSLSEIESLQGHITLYRDDLLVDCYDDWLLIERERCRAFYVDALLRLTQQMRTQSEYIRAIDYAQRVLRIDAAHEKAHQHLIFAFVATGDRASALTQFEECVRSLRAELDVEPAPETIALAQWIRQAPLATKSLAAALTNLPIPLSSFIGRRCETAAVKALLVAGTAQQSSIGNTSPSVASGPPLVRLVTLTGAGGSGKTRLAIQVATDLVDRYHDGVWWVDLSALSDDETLVAQAVARSLGVHEAPNQPLSETVIQFLQSRQLLLVLDNCEHLIAACASLAHALLGRCHKLQILATSRERLGIGGEHIYSVPTLALPDLHAASLAEILLEFEAIRLFVERAQALDARFELTAGNAAAVLQICRSLDGIPLAIELAAAHVRVLSVQQIAARLHNRLDLLTAGSRTAPRRHQTLRATIDWSYDLLADGERVLLRRLSIFSSSFPLEAIDRVCGPLRARLFDLISRLVDKSLVLVEQDGDDVNYRLLETIQEYAREKLVEAGEETLLRSNHLTFYIQLAETADAQFYSTGQERSLMHLEHTHDNVRAALGWAIKQDKAVEALHLGASMGRFWEVRGYWSEGRHWIEQALALAHDAGSSLDTVAGVRGWIAQAEWQASVLAWRQCDYICARDLLEKSLALYRTLDDRDRIANVLAVLGAVAFEQGHYAAAREYYTECLDVRLELGYKDRIGSALFNLGLVVYHQRDNAAAWKLLEQSLLLLKATGNKLDISLTLNALGNVANLQEEYGTARTLYEETLSLRRELGDKRGIAATLNDMANVTAKQGDYALARMLYFESLKLFHELGNQRGMIWALSGLARIQQVQGRLPRAAKLLGAVEALLVATHARLDEPEHSDQEQAIALLRIGLEPAALHSLWEEGRALTLEQAITLATQND